MPRLRKLHQLRRLRYLLRTLWAVRTVWGGAGPCRAGCAGSSGHIRTVLDHDGDFWPKLIDQLPLWKCSRAFPTSIPCHHLEKNINGEFPFNAARAQHKVLRGSESKLGCTHGFCRPRLAATRDAHLLRFPKIDGPRYALFPATSNIERREAGYDLYRLARFVLRLSGFQLPFEEKRGHCRLGFRVCLMLLFIYFEAFPLWARFPALPPQTCKVP